MFDASNYKYSRKRDSDYQIIQLTCVHDFTSEAAQSDSLLLPTLTYRTVRTMGRGEDGAFSALSLWAVFEVSSRVSAHSIGSGMNPDKVEMKLRP